MTKINFVDDSAPDINAQNLNQMQTNIDNAKLEKIASGNITLNYTNNTTLQATINIPGLSSITNIVLTSINAVNGTPYTTVNNISSSKSGDNVTIIASGNGFIQGHLLSVDYIILGR